MVIRPNDNVGKTVCCHRTTRVQAISESESFNTNQAGCCTFLFLIRHRSQAEGRSQKPIALLHALLTDGRLWLSSGSFLARTIARIVGIILSLILLVGHLGCVHLTRILTGMPMGSCRSLSIRFTVPTPTRRSRGISSSGTRTAECLDTFFGQETQEEREDQKEEIWIDSDCCNSNCFPVFWPIGPALPIVHECGPPSKALQTDIHQCIVVKSVSIHSRIGITLKRGPSDI